MSKNNKKNQKKKGLLLGTAALISVYPVLIAEQALAYEPVRYDAYQHSYVASNTEQQPPRSTQQRLQQLLQLNQPRMTPNQVQMKFPYVTPSSYQYLQSTSIDLENATSNLKKAQELLAQKKIEESKLQTKLSTLNQQLTTLQSGLEGSNAKLRTFSQDKEQTYANYLVAQEQYLLVKSQYEGALTNQQQAQEQYNIASNNASAKNEAYLQAKNNYETQLIPAQPTTTTQTPGLTVDIYNNVQVYGTIPSRDTSAYTFCKTITLPNINDYWDGGDIYGCGYDFVMLHYYGYLTFPYTSQSYIWAPADDGFYLSINNVPVIDEWTLKPCYALSAYPYTFEANTSYYVDAWSFEWGGGACSILNYQDQYASGIIPSEYFSTIAITQPEYIHNPELEQLMNIAKSEYESAVEYMQTKESILMEANSILSQSESTYSSSRISLNIQKDAYESATSFYEKEQLNNKDLSVNVLAVKSLIKETTSNLDSVALEIQDLNKTINDIKLVIETLENPPTTPEPTSEAIKEQAYDVLNNSEQGSPEYEAALDQLYLVAQADDIEVPEEVIAVPLIGSAAVALVDTINYIGNAGADMSPKVREESKKVVVSAVVAAGTAIQSAGMAAAAATGNTSTSSRKINK